MLLMGGIVALTMTLVGGAAIQSFTALSNTQGPAADIEISASDGTVTITHAGGETLTEYSIRVIIRSEDGDVQYALDADPIERSGTDDGSFTPGESATFSNQLSGSGEVLVVNQAETAVIARESWSNPGGGTGPAEFNVEINNTNSNVSAGETLEVRATIENIGGTAGT